MSSSEVPASSASSSSRDGTSNDGALLAECPVTETFSTAVTECAVVPDGRCDAELIPSEQSTQTALSSKTYEPGSRRFDLIFIIGGVFPRRKEGKRVWRYVYFFLFLSGMAWCVIRKGILAAIEDLNNEDMDKIVKYESAALQLLDATDLSLHFAFSQCVYGQIRHKPIPYHRFNTLVISGGAMVLASFFVNISQFRSPIAVCFKEMLSDSIFMLPRLGTMTMLLSITKQHAEHLEVFIQRAQCCGVQPAEYAESVLGALYRTQRRWDWFLVLTFLLTCSNLLIIIVIMNHESTDHLPWIQRQNILLPAWYSFAIVTQVFPIAEYNSCIKTAEENILVTGSEEQQLRDLILWKLLATNPPTLKVAGIFNVTRGGIAKAVSISLGSQIVVYLKPFLF